MAAMPDIFRPCPKWTLATDPEVNPRGVNVQSCVYCQHQYDKRVCIVFQRRLLRALGLIPERLL